MGSEGKGEELREVIGSIEGEEEKGRKVERRKI